MTMAMASYTVLVVEDNPDIAVGLHDLLAHDGYAVHTAGSCAEARAALRTLHLNAVLLDVTLPDGDGLCLLSTIHELDPHLPVIIVTASTATDKTVGSLTRGAFAYLTKPFHREELRQTLRRAIGLKELTVKMQRAEHLLVESEDRFRSLVESAIDAILVADERGIIVSHNRSASAMFGYAKDELVGQPLTKLMPARYRDRHRLGLARTEATGQSRCLGTILELQGLKQDGTEFPIELSLATWKTSGGGSLYSGIVRDSSRRKQTEHALDELRKRHTLILTQAGEGIYGIDSEGLTTFANPRAAELLGYPVEALLGRPMHAILHPPHPEGSTCPSEPCPLYTALLNGTPHRTTHEMFMTRDGRSMPVEYVCTPLSEEGRVTGAVVVFRDLTEQRRIESELRAREHRLAYILEGSSDGFWDGHVLPGRPWHDPTTPVWWSPRVRAMLGYTEAEFPDVLDSWATRLHPADRDRVFGALVAHIEHRQPYDIEYRLRTKQGDYRWVRARGQAVWDDAGQPLRMAGSLQCVTGRKRIEESLRRAEHLLQLVFDEPPSARYVKDADGRYLLANPEFHRLFGLPPDRLIGQGDETLSPSALADIFRVHERLALASGSSQQRDERLPLAEGPCWYRSLTIPLFDEQRLPYAILGIASPLPSDPDPAPPSTTGEVWPPS